MTAGALEGLRVVEFCDETGSYCGRLLADLGADVIKVEPPGGGRQRHSPPFARVNGDEVDRSLWFWVHNTSKKSVVLDLDDPDGRSAARKLALTADVVLDDNPVGFLTERDLGYESLSSQKPELVYTTITGFGQTGPHAAYHYSDIVGQAMGGVMTLAGEPDDPPNVLYGHQSDASASIHAAQATLAAVLHAEATGEGQLVDVSAQEALSIAQETAMMTWDLQKRNRTRTGERGMIPVPLPAFGVYQAGDGGYALFYVLAPAGAEFPDLVAWMTERGMAEDLNEEPYATLCSELNMRTITAILSGLGGDVASQVGQLTHINDVVIRFVKSMSAREAYEEGQRRKLLVGLVSTPQDLAKNPQLRARDWFVSFDVDGAAVEFPGAPYRLSDTPVVIGRPPRLGEHTAAILADL